jgi:hypothetical protein
MWCCRRPNVVLQKAKRGAAEGQMWCCKRPNVVLQKAKRGAAEGQISWTDRVRNEAVLKISRRRGMSYI